MGDSSPIIRQPADASGAPWDRGLTPLGTYVVDFHLTSVPDVTRSESVTQNSDPLHKSLSRTSTQPAQSALGDAMFRRSASKKNVSSLGNGTPSNPVGQDLSEMASLNLSDQSGSRASSLLVVPNDAQTATNGEGGDSNAPSPKRRTSLR